MGSISISTRRSITSFFVFYAAPEAVLQTHCHPTTFTVRPDIDVMVFNVPINQSLANLLCPSVMKISGVPYQSIIASNTATQKLVCQLALKIFHLVKVFKVF